MTDLLGAALVYTITLQGHVKNDADDWGSMVSVAVASIDPTVPA